MQKRHINPPKNPISHAISNISQHTIDLLNYLLPIILFSFVYSAILFYIDLKNDPTRAIMLFYSTGEHLMMSLFLTISGSVLFDISIFENSHK